MIATENRISPEFDSCGVPEHGPGLNGPAEFYQDAQDACPGKSSQADDDSHICEQPQLVEQVRQAIITLANAGPIGRRSTANASRDIEIAVHETVRPVAGSRLIAKTGMVAGPS